MKKLVLTLLSVFLISLVQAQVKPEGLFINSRAPDFKATDQDGNEVVMKDLRKKGDVIVVFYRGSWCPFCSRYLKKLQDSLQAIQAKGASIVVITPRLPRNSSPRSGKSSTIMPGVRRVSARIRPWSSTRQARMGSSMR